MFIALYFYSIIGKKYFECVFFIEFQEFYPKRFFEEIYISIQYTRKPITGPKETIL